MAELVSKKVQAKFASYVDDLGAMLSATAENKMFGASYHVVFADAYCDVPPAQKDLRDRLADFKYGQFLKVSGKISSVTNEGLHLWDCSMEVAERPAGYKDAEDLVNELFKKPSGQ